MVTDDKLAGLAKIIQHPDKWEDTTKYFLDHFASDQEFMDVPVPPRRHPAAAWGAAQGALDRRRLYAATRPLLSFAARHLPRYMTTSVQMGRAMIAVVREAGPSRVLESADIKRF